MKRIINLTQHAPTKEQIEQGVIVNTVEDQQKIKDLTTFNGIESTGPDKVWQRCGELLVLMESLSEKYDTVHVIMESF